MSNQRLLVTRDEQLKWLRSQHATQEIIEKMVFQSSDPRNWQWLLDLAKDL